MEGYHSQEQKNDSRYVKYLVRLYGVNEGKEFEKIIPYHKCTDADWAQFPPPQSKSVSAFNSIRADPKRGMFCLDWDNEDLLLYGDEKKSEYTYQRIEFDMTPCNYLHTHLGFEGDTIHDACIYDLDEQIENLGSLNFVLYHTEEVFQPN